MCSMGQVKVSQELECLICGDWVWEKNDDRREFSIEIYKNDTLLYGKHCYILNSGDKMDCSVTDEDISFRTEYTNTSTIIVEINSFYLGEKGRAEIKLIGENLYWKLLKEPKGEYYLPMEAILHRERE